MGGGADAGRPADAGNASRSPDDHLAEAGPASRTPTQGLYVYVHVLVVMAVKTITITEDAYRKLSRLKRGNESFSEAINRVLGGPSALELEGLLDSLPGDEVEARIRAVRRELDTGAKRTRKAVSA